MKWRYTTLQIFFLCLAIAIFLRLTYWQIIAADDLKSQAQNQRSSSILLPSRRGDIRSVDQFPLATDQDRYLLYANPKLTFPILDLLPFMSASASAQVSDKLSKSDLSWVALEHRITPATRDQILALKLPGVGFELEPVRSYPEASISAHLLGFVGQDENGLPKGYFGLEGYYNRQLSGKPGRLLQEHDALNRPIVIGSQSRISPQEGKHLATSIDRTLQFIVYNKLSQALTRYQAASGTVTIMDPDNGQIIAMVSLPNYDPGLYWEYPTSIYTNPVIAETYEPGSIFKVIIMASALDAGSITPESICDICDAAVQVDDYVLKTWNDKYFPNSNMSQIIMHSDNVGMVYVGRKLGRQKMISYLKNFGFNDKTGIDLQEESIGEFRSDSQWKEVDLATVSFGQGIAVTPVQMVRAISAIANGGNLITPRVVQSSKTPSFKRVISKSASSQITQIMVNAVDNGEIKYLKPKGFSIAGKTGTAQVPIAGHYDAEKTVASYIGFAPAYNPKFAMLVTLHNPKSAPWASQTAAPLWFDISKEIFRYWKISPQ